MANTDRRAARRLPACLPAPGRAACLLPGAGVLDSLGMGWAGPTARAYSCGALANNFYFLNFLHILTRVGR